MEPNRNIKIDGDYLNSYQDEINDMQFDKLSQKMTFFTIAITCIVGFSLAFGYFYLKDNVKNIPEEVEELSKHVVERLSSVSERYESLENALNSKISILDKVTEGFRQSQKEIKAVIEGIENSKLGKDDINQIVEKTSNQTNKSIVDLKKEISNYNATYNEHITSINAKIDTVDTKTQNLNNIINALQKNVDKFKTTYDEVSSLLSDAVNLETLDKRIKQEKEDYQNTIARQKAILEKKIQVLEDQFNEIKKKIKNINTSVNNKHNNTKFSSETIQKPVIEKQNIQSQTNDDQSPNSVNVKRPSQDLIKKRDIPVVTPKMETETYMQIEDVKPTPKPGTYYEEEILE